MSNLEKSSHVSSSSPPIPTVEVSQSNNLKEPQDGSSGRQQSSKSHEIQGQISVEADKKPVVFVESTIPQPQTDGNQPEFDPNYTSVEILTRYVADEDDPIVAGFNFNDESLRRGFIRKVYGILSVMLCFTIASVLLFIFREPVTEFAKQTLWLFFVAIAVMIVLLIAIACCESVRRTFPTNLISLALFTASFSVIVAHIAVLYDRDTVLLAMSTTAIVVISLTLFAVQSKIDFNIWASFLFVALIVSLSALFAGFFLPIHYAYVLYSWIGAIIYSLYLICDTILIIGGNHNFQVSPEEYVLGAMVLFIDIIYLFLYILRIFGSAK